MEKAKRGITKEQFWTCVGALILSGIMGIIGNFIGYEHVMPLESVPGMIILVIIGIVGYVISRFILRSLPSFVHVSIVAILLTMPWNPVSTHIMYYVSKIQLMAVVTPILAYAGLTVGRDWKAFTKLGWKAVIVGTLVIFGTFFWSAFIAEVMM